MRVSSASPFVPDYLMQQSPYGLTAPAFTPMDQYGLGQGLSPEAMMMLALMTAPPQVISAVTELLGLLVEWMQSNGSQLPQQGGGQMHEGLPPQSYADMKRVPQGNGTAGDFLEAALAQNGDRYVFGAEASKNDADPDTFDCSELVEWAAAQAGVHIADGSWNQRDSSIPISVEEALRTPGALLFSDGHVAISLGDGRTIEARGSRYGVGIFDAGSRFHSGGLIPGMQYA